MSLQLRSEKSCMCDECQIELYCRYDLRKFGFSSRWLIHGIVYLTGLFLLIPLTIHLKLDWINFGTVKILYIILEHSCREPEVVVECCVRNFSNLVYCKVISRCGHRSFGLRLSTPSTSTSVYGRHG